MTQPAVSQYLAALGVAVGKPLFKRTHRLMVPTEKGKELYARVAGAVEALERASRVGDEEENPLVRIGAPLEYFYEAALERLKGARLRFWVRFGVARALLGKLERGYLDLVIATQRLPIRALQYDGLAEERFLLVGPPELAPPAAVESAGDLTSRVEDWLGEQAWISYGANLPIVRRFWQQSFGRRPEIRRPEIRPPVLVVPDLRAVQKAVELGHGVSVLPDYLCRSAVEAGRLRVPWSPPEPVTNELWLARRKLDANDPELGRAAALLRAPA